MAIEAGVGVEVIVPVGVCVGEAVGLAVPIRALAAAGEASEHIVPTTVPVPAWPGSRSHSHRDAIDEHLIFGCVADLI